MLREPSFWVSAVCSTSWRRETPYRRRHLAFDLAVIAICTVLVAVLTIWLLDGILRAWMVEHLELASTILAWPLFLRISLALVIGDFGYYVMHRSMHTDVLWRTHVFHHSIQEVYWFSGLRTSAMNPLLIRLPYLVAFMREFKERHS